MNQLSNILKACCAFALMTSSAAPAIAADTDLNELSIAELMNIEITSVSKKPQTMASAAAAAFVISQEDIRRSGATTIPDVLRMVPGLQVAKIDSNLWAVSIRGFNNVVANKLLVLKDGRSLYTPAYSGVYWEQQDTPLELIDRIEVIRGPGAALWGSNAVNGVINIITKHAADTKGGMLSTGGGTTERGFGTGSYGFALNESVDMRLYAKYANKGPGEMSNGTEAHDSWQSGSMGFKMDAQLSDADSLSLQGGFLKGSYDETGTLYQLPTFTDPRYSHQVDATTGMINGNLLVNWERTLSNTDSIFLKAYYDYYENHFYALDENFHAVDLDFQHRFRFANHHDLIWGLGYRYTYGTLAGDSYIASQTVNSTNNLFSIFVHDEIMLLPDRLSLIVGCRLEHNDYTGFEVQPNARLLWTPIKQHSIWAAVSRAVRTPAITDREVVYPQFRTMSPAETGLPLPLRLQMNGNRNQQSETVIAYELGYRTTPLQNVSVDLALFYNQ